MAYSNWGSFVFRDGTRRTDREDVAVFGDDGSGVPSAARIFANLIATREKYPDGNPPWYEHAHHAVLGDGPVRLVGYKSRPELWHAADDGTVTAIDLLPFRTSEASDDWDDATYQGIYEGVRFRVEMFNNNMVDLELVEADGSHWSARCGYCYGAGWMDDDQAHEILRQIADVQPESED